MSTLAELLRACWHSLCCTSHSRGSYREVADLAVFALAAAAPILAFTASVRRFSKAAFSVWRARSFSSRAASSFSRAASLCSASCRHPERHEDSEACLKRTSG